MRIVGFIGLACVVGGIALIATGAETPGAVTLVVGILIETVVGLVGAVRKVHGQVKDVQSLVSGGGPRAGRIVEVGPPKGLFSPASNVVIEVDKADGSVGRYDRDVPVPFPYAIGYRLSRRFKLPFVSRDDLGELLKFELRRDGEEVELAGAEERVGALPTVPASGSLPTDGDDRGERQS